MEGALVFMILLNRAMGLSQQGYFVKTDGVTEAFFFFFNKEKERKPQAF